MKSILKGKHKNIHNLRKHNGIYNIDVFMGNEMLEICLTKVIKYNLDFIHHMFEISQFRLICIIENEIFSEF